MSKPAILCIDDQREVLAAVKKDLAIFESHCELIFCESADEAMEVLEEKENAAEDVAVILCDHLMAKQNGVEFLIEVNNDSRFKNIKKLLLTGMATHKDTITAINHADIDRYIEKPWNAEELQKTVKILLTQYIMQMGLEYQNFVQVLDQDTLMDELRQRG